MSVQNKPWKYCVVGNIVKEHTDKDGIHRHGVAAFVGGTKVYLCGKYWDSSLTTIGVLGLSRAKRWYFATVQPCHIENVRCGTVYKPSVIEMMDHYEYAKCWWGNTQEDKAAVKMFVKQWNNSVFHLNQD